MHFANIKRKRSLRYFIELSYFGKAYHGWQNQPDSISVQEVLEDNLRKVLRSKTNILGAGRTDAGVHAKQMFAHFDNSESVDTALLKYKLNSMLPKDVAILISSRLRKMLMPDLMRLPEVMSIILCRRKMLLRKILHGL